MTYAIKLSTTDRILSELQGLFSKPEATLSRPSPAQNTEEANLTENYRKLVISLMRINHCGEICAQALYHGQMVMAQNQFMYNHLEESALEEQDHLLWCKQRVEELGGSVSLLASIFYVQSLIIGILVSTRGDEFSLGFITETETQVFEHLQSHIDKLHIDDEKTRLILQTMQEDEKKHGDSAHALGGKEMPLAVKYAMKLTAKCMTKITHYL